MEGGDIFRFLKHPDPEFAKHKIPAQRERLINMLHKSDGKITKEIKKLHNKLGAAEKYHYGSATSLSNRINAYEDEKTSETRMKNGLPKIFTEEETRAAKNKIHNYEKQLNNKGKLSNETKMAKETVAASYTTGGGKTRKKSRK